jgi:hypothetical protein
MNIKVCGVKSVLGESIFQRLLPLETGQVSIFFPPVPLTNSPHHHSQNLTGPRADLADWYTQWNLLLNAAY